MTIYDADVFDVVNDSLICDFLGQLTKPPGLKADTFSPVEALLDTELPDNPFAKLLGNKTNVKEDYNRLMSGKLALFLVSFEGHEYLHESRSAV